MLVPSMYLNVICYKKFLKEKNIKKTIENKQIILIIKANK